MRTRFVRIHHSVVLLFTFAAAPASASSMLGSATSFAVLGASTVTNTGATTITGNMGVDPGTSMTGVGLITLHGGLNQANAAASLARSDATAADVTLAAQPVTQDLTGEDLGTLGVLTPGVYSFASSAQLTGTLTLNFEGLNDPFVFLIGSTLTTASASSIVVENGNPSSAIFWWVGSSATLGTGTVFDGNILADQSITMNTGASIACGRALALNAAVTLDTNVVSNDCGAGDFGSKGFSGGGLSVSPTPEPTTWAMMLIGFGIVGGLGRATRRRRGFAPAA